MNCKIIYISHGPLSIALAKALCLETLMEKGITIEWWDIVSLINESHVNHHLQNLSHLVTQITTWDDLKEKIRLNSDIAIFDAQTNFELRFWKMFFYLKKYNCKTFFVYPVSFPAPTIQKRILNKLLSLSLFITVRNRILSYLLFTFKIIKRYDLILTVGLSAQKSFGKYSKVIPINSHDYETYMTHPNVIEKTAPYIVFLDQYLPHHPDLQLQTTNTDLINPEKYYTELNAFFDLIEKMYGANVIIAQHPKANYINFNPFNGRKIFNNQTIDLVSNASLAITHGSASFAYAILYDKPLIFLYNDDIKKNLAAVYTLILTLSNYLEIEPIDFSSGVTHTAPLQTNTTKYQAYKYDFLTNKSTENLTNDVIMYNSLKSLSTTLNFNKKVS
jgi:hypothetical protein